MLYKKTTRQKKYFAPQNEDGKHKCDHPDCKEDGEFRAPKDRGLKSYYWFCLKHVQEYNAKWDYYDGQEDQDEQARKEQEEKAKYSRRFKFHSKVKYNFGFDFNGDFEFFDDYESNRKDSGNMNFSGEDKQSLIAMELVSEGLSLEILKKQYKILVKKYHPDVNQGDSQAEEKFKILGNAYKSLLKKLS